MFIHIPKCFSEKIFFPILLFAVIFVVIPCLILIGGTVLMYNSSFESCETFQGSHDECRNNTGIHDKIKGSMKLVCYYNFPRTDNDLQPEDIPGDLCTHINIAFVGINPTNFSISISESHMKIISILSTIKKKNNDLKFIISVGGAGVSTFRPMIVNHHNRKLFINSTMKFIKKFKLDGVDIDWEWPGDNGNTKEKVKFIQLLKEFREEFNRHEKSYILSVAVGSQEPQIKMSYYIYYMSEYVDFVNLLTYDYHFFTTYYPLTDHNSPLYASAKDKNTVSSVLNVNYSVNYWIGELMPKDKIILGLPTYGHTYRLLSSLNHDLHSPANGVGSVGVNGEILYNEVCHFTKRINTFIVFDEDAKVPYAYNHYDWISYDDERSVFLKASYILENNIGGAMIYSLNADDYCGLCKKGVTFPLVRVVRSVFDGSRLS